MIDGYHIFDDIISESDQTKLEEYVKLPNLKWNYLHQDSKRWQLQLGFLSGFL